MYHVNPETGEVRICYAKNPETCPFGCENHSDKFEIIQIKADKINKRKRLSYEDSINIINSDECEINNVIFDKYSINFDDVYKAFSGRTFNNTDFSKLNFINFNIENATFNKCIFPNWIDNTSFINTNFNNCDFTNANDTRDISFKKCVLNKCAFSHFSYFDYAVISDTEFNQCEWNGFFIRNSKLYNTKFNDKEDDKISIINYEDH